MDYFLEVIILLFYFALYGVVHSVLASIRIKEIVRRYIGRYIAFYRLTYNISAVLGLYLIWEFAPHPTFQVYELNYPVDLIVFGLQLLSLAGIFWCFNYICFREFLGMSQVDRFLNGTYDSNDLDEKLTFRIAGPYKYSRHPVYLFSILFLLFRPEMNLFYLTMFLSFVLYFYVGSVYEEKKLLRLFGEDYVAYQKTVSRIFPFKALLKISDKKSVREIS